LATAFQFQDRHHIEVNDLRVERNRWDRDKDRRGPVLRRRTRCDDSEPRRREGFLRLVSAHGWVGDGLLGVTTQVPT
jgi:hypothetical protein